MADESEEVLENITSIRRSHQQRKVVSVYKGNSAQAGLQTGVNCIFWPGWLLRGFQPRNGIASKADDAAILTEDKEDKTAIGAAAYLKTAVTSIR